MEAFMIGFAVLAAAGILKNSESIRTDPEKNYRDYELGVTDDCEDVNEYLD